MTAYIVRRVLLMIPTLFGIMVVSFIIVQFAPGGPVERIIAQLTGTDVAATARIGGTADPAISAGRLRWRWGRQLITVSRRAGPRSRIHREARKAVRLRQAPHERFAMMMWNYITFDFGESYFRDVSVIGLIAKNCPSPSRSAYG